METRRLLKNDNLTTSIQPIYGNDSVVSCHAIATLLLAANAGLVQSTVPDVDATDGVTTILCLIVTYALTVVHG